MLPVTVIAVRCELVTPGDGLAVERSGVKVRLVLMAGAAVDRLEFFVVREFLAFEVGVARHAGQRAVDRPGKELLVDEDGDCFSVAGAGEGFVLMTPQAVAVLLTGRSAAQDNGQEDESRGTTSYQCRHRLPVPRIAHGAGG